MNRNRLRRILILMAAALVCLVMARVSYGGQAADAGRLTLWFSLSDCPQDAMESLLSSCYRDYGLRVEATAYPDEEALGAAFESGRPDLLFCSESRAALLGGSPATATDAAFFELGSRLPLLVVNTGLTDARFEDLESLLDAADTDSPFLVSDCWADLLYTALASLGESMTGDRELDEASGRYAALYNRLALASFRGGLVSREKAAEYVRQGLVPFAVARSLSLAGMKEEGVAVLPLPLPSAGERRYMAERMGFAVLDGADAEGVEIFRRWLETNSGAELAWFMGLVPPADSPSGAAADTPLKRTLASLVGGGALSWPDADEAFFQNRAACERGLREALDLLA